MSEQAQEQQDRPSMEEFVESLTGYEEIAIEKAFGAAVVSLLDTNPTMSARALVFVARKRDGMKDQEARKAVMEMRLGDVQGFFPDEEPEVDEDNPVTDAGKGDEQPG